MAYRLRLLTLKVNTNPHHSVVRLTVGGRRAATTLFLSKGYDGTRMDDSAARTGPVGELVRLADQDHAV